LIAGREEVAEAKINNLDIAHLADEDVLDFEITVDDAVSMAVVEGAGYLAGKLARLLFLEAAVGDDVVEHLAAIDKLEHHVPVEVCPDDILHAADIRMVQEADDGGLSGSADFLGVVGSFAVGSALVLVLRLTGHNLDGGLDGVSKAPLVVDRPGISSSQGHAPRPMWETCKGTHLFSSIDVLGKLDLSHTASADCLSERPCSCARGGDGGPALVDGLGLDRPGIDSYAVDGHCGSRRRVRRIPRMASSTRIGARGILGATGGRVFVGEVALLVVAAGDVSSGLRAIGTVSRPARCGGGAHDGGRCWGSGRRHGDDVVPGGRRDNAGSRRGPARAGRTGRRASAGLDHVGPMQTA
jgi:hypothetical protein